MLVRTHQHRDNNRKNNLAEEKRTVNGKKVKYLWNDAVYSYENNGQKFRLIIYCAYFFLTSFVVFVSALFLHL